MITQLRHAPTRKIVFTGVFALLFGLIDIAAQNTLYPPEPFSIFRAILAFIVPALAAWLLFTILDWQAARTRSTAVEAPDQTVPADPRTGWRLHLPALVSLPLNLLTWGVLFATFWPMASMNDTYHIIKEPLAVAGWHPLGYEVWLNLWVKAGTALTGGMTGGVILAGAVQLLLWMLVLAGVLFFLARRGTPRWMQWALVAYFALNPIIANYSFATIKDSIFSLAVVALAPLLVIVWEDRGASLSGVPFFCALATTLVAFAIFRNNGLAVIAVVLIALLLRNSGKRRLTLLLAVVSGVLAISPTLTTETLGASPTAARESLGVPLQLVNYTIVNEPSCIPPADESFFNELKPIDGWKRDFMPARIDNTKFAPDFNNAFLENNTDEFASHFLSTAQACPTEFLEGWGVHTRDLWAFTVRAVGPREQSVFPSIVSNVPSPNYYLDYFHENGVVNHPLLPDSAAQAVTTAFYRAADSFPGPGRWMWASLLLIAGFWYRRRSEWIPLFGPSMLLWASLLVATPFTEPFRYVMFIVVVVPFAAALLFTPKRTDRLTV